MDNLIKDNKCKRSIIRGSASGTVSTGTGFLDFLHVDGNIGDGAVITVSQRIVQGDVALSSISTFYAYNEGTGKTDFAIYYTNSTQNEGTVHLNYMIIPS